MFFAASLLTFLAVALSITESPVEVRNSRVTLPMTRGPTFSNGTNLVQHNHDDAQRASVLLAGDNNWGCTISVSIGMPPTFYVLNVDTGSSLTWVGAGHRDVATDTGFDTEEPLEVNYKSAFFKGTLFHDTVTLPNMFTIDEMSIGVASESKGVPHDGIFGIGPTRLSLGDLKDTPDKTISTITDSLFDQGIISQPLVSLCFQPSARGRNDDGVLTFGETNPALYVGDIAYTSITKTEGASNYWGIDQSITYGTAEISRRTAGIVDCGTTFIYLASDAYNMYWVATGANFDATTELLSITLERYGVLLDLDFHINGKTYSLTPNAQIWPRWLNYRLGGVDDGIYLVFKSLGTPTGHGNDFRLGYVFLQRFYSVFDTRESRVGFAETIYTRDISN
ncbi:family A1 protease [Suillus spraguei]|nr:family A1 protease [Suillus spraguei]